MSFSSYDVFFFNQKSRCRTERRRKEPHELPQALRYSNVNPKLAAFLATKDKGEREDEDGKAAEESARTNLSSGASQAGPVTQEVPVPSKPTVQLKVDAHPTIGSSAKSHTAPQHGESDEWDVQRLMYEEFRRNSVNLLQRLSKLLYNRPKNHGNIPRFLAYQLEANWNHLTAETRFDERDWQTIACREAAKQRQSDEERRKREQLSSVPPPELSPSGHENEDGIDVVDGRKNKKRPGMGIAENGDVLSSEQSTGRLKRDTSIPQINTTPSAPRKNSQTASVLSTNRLLTARSSSGTGRSLGGSARHSISARRQSSLLKVPGGSGGLRGAMGASMDDIMSERTSLGSRSKMCIEKESSTAIVPPLNATIQEPTRGYYLTTIQFLLSSKDCDEKGWIKHEEGRSPKELTLQWARIRLSSAIKAKKESERLDVEHQLTVRPEVELYGNSSPNPSVSLSRRQLPRPHTTQPGSQPLVPKLNSPSSASFQQSCPSYLAPVLPVLQWQVNPSRRTFRAVSNDGTTSVYYPNGGLAVLVSHAGPGKKGFFVHAFDQGASATEVGRMLLTFTPYGRGACHHSNGMLWFVAFEKGCSLHDSRGARLKRYKWPAPTSKLPSSMILHLNDHLTFRCWSRKEMSLVYSSGSCSSTFQLGVDNEALECKAKETDDLTFLLSGLQFTSQTAKDLIKPSGKKQRQQQPQRRAPRRVTTMEDFSEDKYKLQLAELQKSWDTDAHLYDSVLDKELARIQRKLKHMCDSWLEHYRIHLGILLPHLKTMSENPDFRAVRKRPVKSAHHVTCSVDIATQRTTSAPLRRPLTASTNVSSTPGNTTGGQSSAAVKFDDASRNTPDNALVPTVDICGSMPTAGGGDPGEVRLQSSVGFSVASNGRSDHFSDIMLPMPCPVVCRSLMMGLATVGCRCNRARIPYITDLEYEYFLQRVVSPEQLVVIGIVSSAMSLASSPPCIGVLDALYERQNRNRPHPCTLSRHDDFRIFLYDISTAAKTTPCTQALLLRRHNVIPGMCLMYQAGRLLFADQIFNGYSITRRDLTKQIEQCRMQAMRGQTLPVDFRFQTQPQRRFFGREKLRPTDRHVTLLVDGDDQSSSSSLPFNTANLQSNSLHSESMGSSIVAYY